MLAGTAVRPRRCDTNFICCPFLPASRNRVDGARAARCLLTMYSWPTAARFPSTGHKDERQASSHSGRAVGIRRPGHGSFPFADEAEGVRLAEIREFQLGSAMAVPSQLGSDGACSRAHRVFCARCVRDWSGCLLELPSRADQGLCLGCLHRAGQPVDARDPGHHHAELVPAELLTLQVGEMPSEVSEFPGGDDPAEDGKTTVSSRASCGWYTRRWLRGRQPGPGSGAGHAPGGLAFARMNWVSTPPPTSWTSSIVTVPVRTPAEAGAGEGSGDPARAQALAPASAARRTG